MQTKKFLALLLALVSLSSPSLALQSAPPAGWEKFTSEPGRFSILMPGKPKEDRKTADTPYGPSTTHIFIAQAPGAIYLAGWVDYDPSFKFGVQAEMEANRDNLVKAMKATVIETKPIKYRTSPGIEFTAENETIFIRSRVYIIGRRPYQTIAVVRKTDSASPDIEKFLSSFAITRAD
ncbi:MAG TPA: hypothetical protein VER32_13865 [Pyrinomonadaceae bacterium]|nr:hypothetical protein [Pyrinomonadaceae bacterium]